MFHICSFFIHANADGFSHDTIFADSSKIEGNDGNRPLRERVLLKFGNDSMDQVFFAYVITGSVGF